MHTLWTGLHRERETSRANRSARGIFSPTHAPQSGFDRREERAVVGNARPYDSVTEGTKRTGNKQ